MKHAVARCMIAITILALFAVPGHLAAAQGPPRYIAIDMGTFGGPNADFNLPGRPMNAQGTIIGSADSSTPDPYAPNCVTPDCLDLLGFAWHHAVLTQLPSLGGLVDYPYAIADNGSIAGSSEINVTDPVNGLPESRAVVWTHGRILNLGTPPGGIESLGFAMNERGQVTGPWSNGTPSPYSCQFFNCWGLQTRGFIWQNGVMKDLGTLGTGRETLPLFMNNQGQITGQAFTTDTPNAVTGVPAMDPFLWQNGHMQDLGTLGGTFGFPNGINSQGEVVGQSDLAGDQGYHPFLWNGGGMIDLGTLGGSFGTANWINDAGHVVGWATTPGDETAHGFLWENGRMIDLGTTSGQTCANANVVNASDQVVGGTCDPLGDGWLWEGGTMHDLNSLVAPSSVRLAEAHYLSDQGEIVCRGVLANGDVHLMMLVPSALAASQGLTSNVPAGSPPGAHTSNPHADLNSLLHASQFRRDRP